MIDSSFSNINSLATFGARKLYTPYYTLINSFTNSLLFSFQVRSRDQSISPLITHQNYVIGSPPARQFTTVKNGSLENNIKINPAILNLNSKLESYLTECDNPLLISYANSVLLLNLDELCAKYSKSITSPIVTLDLPGD